MKSIIGRKIGMTSVFATDGTMYPVSVVEVLPNVVIQKKTVENDGYEALQVALEEKIKPIQELISKFQKQVEVLTKKEEEKTTQTETTTRDAGIEASRSEDSSYIQSYPETNGSISNSQAPAAEQSSSGSASSGGDNGANTGGQTADSSGSQSESNSVTTSSSN